MHDEKQETEREYFDFEKSTEAIGIDQNQQPHSDVEINEDDDDMEKQLNPEAAEFVPTSPPTSAPLSPFGNGPAALISNRPDLLDDDLLAQSPRKSVAPAMEDFALPSENDFSEISKRPSELLQTSPTALNGDAERPGSSSSQCSYQEMNMKEAMHGDEKQEFAAEVPEAINLNLEPSVAEIDLLQGDDGTVRTLRDQDPMHMSFYKDRDENGSPQTNPFAEPEVDMNAVQPLPESDDEASNERDEFDVLVSGPVMRSNGFDKQQPAMELEADVPLSSYMDKIYTENQEIPTAESELINVNVSSPITQVVQEMASEVTSILDELDEHHHNAEQLAAEHHEFGIPDLSNDAVADVINKSDLSAAASEFNPSQFHIETTQSPVEAEPLVSPVGEPASTIQPIEPIDDVPIAPTDASVQEESKVDLLAAAGVATATAIAAAAVAAAKSPTQAKEPKVTAATKKPTTLVAKKPAAAPLKSSLKPAVSTTRTSATSPSKAIASKVTTTAAAAPKPTVRTVKAPIEKKTTATLSAAAKRPIGNGVVTTTVKKTSTTTSSTTAAAIKSTVGAPKPPVHATKTTTLRTASAATSGAAPTKTSSLSKPATTTASARVPLSARYLFVSVSRINFIWTKF